MMQRPIFPPRFRVEIITGEGVFLLGEERHHVLIGSLYEQVAPFLDGRHAADDIVEKLAGTLPAAEVYYTLAALEKRGLLQERDPTPERSPAVSLPLREGTLDADPDWPRVEVVCLGGLESGPLVDALAALGIGVAGEAGLRIVLTDDYLRSGLAEVNAAAWQDGRPWLLVKPVGRELFVGPLFVPGRTGCWRCLAERHILHRAVERFVMDRRGQADPLPLPLAATAATVRVACELAAQETARWFGQGEPPGLEGRAISVNTRTWVTRSHRLTRLPRCPACGRPGDRSSLPPPPVALSPGQAPGPAGFDFRTSSPQQTAERLDGLVSPLTGIVGAIVPDPDLDGLACGCQANHHFLLHFDGSAFRRAGLQFVSAGKGHSEAEARASLLGEAVERFSGLFQGDEPRIAASLASLGGDAVPPGECLLFSRRQYLNRRRLNARSSHCNRIPEPFEDEAREIEWTPVWSLTQGAVRYLPTQYLYYGYVHPNGRGDPVFFPADSNGCAAGNTMEEAALHGFLELVERDSVALWWYNRLSKPAVDLTSFGRPELADLAAAHGRIGREVWALDLTGDLGIPAFAALSSQAGPSGQRLAFGFGCHLDAGLALRRAMDEMNQCYAIGRKAFRENPDGRLAPEAERLALFSFGDGGTYRWWQGASRASQPYLAPADGRPPRRLDEFPAPVSPDLGESLARCVEIARRQGLEVLVLDQSRDGAGLRVAKVVVPGLRHFWARLAPGRLYDVPVRMGWLPKPLAEEELNPMAVFI